MNIRVCFFGLVTTSRERFRVPRVVGSASLGQAVHVIVRPAGPIGGAEGETNRTAAVRLGNDGVGANR